MMAVSKESEHTCTNTLSDTRAGVRVREVWCEVISPYVNRKSRGKTRYRGNPLFKCQAVLVILSLLFLFPLFAPLKAPTLHLHLSSAACCCMFVHVGVTMWVCTCQLRAHIHDPGRALGKDDTDRFLFSRHQNLPTGEKKNERRMQAGMKRCQQLQREADGKT